MTKDSFESGEVVGTLDCADPATGQEFVIVAVSGIPAEVEQIYETIRPRLPQSYVYASPFVDPNYWAGRSDPRFRPGRNEDGSTYGGDSLSCVEPRMYQYAKRMGWRVRGMTLAWRGTGGNPFPYEPQNATADRMRPCPSCEANMQAILSGVDVAD